MKKVAFLLFGLCMASSGLSYAETRPVNLALVDPVQVFDDSYDISGFRLNLLYGKNATVKGLDLGVGVGHSKDGFKGIGIHYGANFVQGDAAGLQLADFTNIVIGHYTGVQLSGVNFVKNSGKGLQLGYVNIVKEDFGGIQLSAVNLTSGNYEGVQLGVVNYTAENFSGLQLGLVNIGGLQKGIQIGLVNVNTNKKPLPFFPIVNLRF